jgi:hypothetical protein
MISNVRRSTCIMLITFYHAPPLSICSQLSFVSAAYCLLLLWQSETHDGDVFCFLGLAMWMQRHCNVIDACAEYSNILGAHFAPARFNCGWWPSRTCISPAGGWRLCCGQLSSPSSSQQRGGESEPGILSLWKDGRVVSTEY